VKRRPVRPQNMCIRRARNSKTSVETLRDRPRGIKSPIIRPRLLLFTEPTPVPGWHGLRISPQASLGSGSLLLGISELLVIRVFDIVPGHPRSDDCFIDLGATDDTSFIVQSESPLPTEPAIPNSSPDFSPLHLVRSKPLCRHCCSAAWSPRSS